MGFIITDGADYFSEKKRDANCQIHWMADGGPGFRLVNTCRCARYEISKEIVTDPQRDVVLQHTRFAAREGTRSDYKLFILLAPHLGAAFSLPQFKDVLRWVSIGSLMALCRFVRRRARSGFLADLSEIYPLRIRGRVMSVGTAANWSADLLVALTFLTLTKVIGKPATFWLYGVVTVVNGYAA